jgi:hypothetical protein
MTPSKLAISFALNDDRKWLVDIDGDFSKQMKISGCECLKKLAAKKKKEVLVILGQVMTHSNDIYNNQ